MNHQDKSNQEQPPSKLRTADGENYDSNDIFVRGRAAPIPDIRIPIQDNSEAYTTEGSQ